MSNGRRLEEPLTGSGDFLLELGKGTGYENLRIKENVRKTICVKDSLCPPQSVRDFLEYLLHLFAYMVFIHFMRFKNSIDVHVKPYALSNWKSWSCVDSHSTQGST